MTDEEKVAKYGRLFAAVMAKRDGTGTQAQVAEAIHAALDFPPCPRCEGSGIDRHGQCGAPCSECNGRGWMLP